MRNEGKIGVWLIGALGSIATTVIIGALALRKGLTGPTGMLTETPPFDGVSLTAVENLEFGGCDVRREDFIQAAWHLSRATGAIAPQLIDSLQEELSAVAPYIVMGTACNCGEAIGQLAGGNATGKEQSLRDEIAGARACIQRFKEEKELRDVVVVNLASTEPPLDLQEAHLDLSALNVALDRNDTAAACASTIYAYAAIEEGCPYINFTPSTGALFPAIVHLAEKNGVPVMGSDGKTGETLVKSALAPMFMCRNLDVLSWEGFNILGNMDGSVLNHPKNCESKIRTKDQVLAKILGYTPHSRVRIDYVPSLDDQKTAWDFIHFRGFLGAKMSLQFIWQGFDSILAAPLVLDLVRLADLSKRRGESGLMPHLASYFKAPLGVSEHRLYEQYEMLMDYVRQVKNR
jgi:myo-inositol-1-phosphate synthase